MIRITNLTRAPHLLRTLPNINPTTLVMQLYLILRAFIAYEVHSDIITELWYFYMPHKCILPGYTYVGRCLSCTLCILLRGVTW